MEDILHSKRQRIERCIARVHEEYNNDSARLENYSHQDAIVMNIQRISEASLDMANYFIKKYKLGVPQTRKESFQILEREGIIEQGLSTNLQAMIDFCDVAVHDCLALQIPMIEKVILTQLQEGLLLADILSQQDKEMIMKKAVLEGIVSS